MSDDELARRRGQRDEDVLASLAGRAVESADNLADLEVDLADNGLARESRTVNTVRITLTELAAHIRRSRKQ